MKLKLYACYDRAAGNYASPFVMENDALAIRAFNNAIKDNPFKADMSLYCLGIYDSETARIESNVTFMCNYTGE